MAENRYSTLRDYLALLRRQKLIVVAAIVAFGGAAFALSASQEESYEALATTQYNDIARDASFAGSIDLPADINPVQNAFIKAEDVASLDTARRVRKKLETDISPERLQSAIETKVDAQSFLLEITATWDDPEFAARLANTFAEVNVEDENRRLERQLEATVEDLEPRTKGDVVNDAGVVNLPVFNARSALSAVSTLRALVDEGVVVPAEVARRAEPPDAAASPRTARNTILGAIVGLAIGLLAAFARDSLDRRIRTSADAHDVFELPVLGRVGQSALGTTGAARSSNGPGFVRPADIEAFRILRTNMAALTPGRPPRSVLVTSGLPQEGKTTVAISLAAASAAAGQRTLLVDGDLRRPAVAQRLGLPATPGLSEYLARTAEPRDILHTVSVSAMGGGSNGASEDERVLVCIPAGNAQGEPAELLASDRCRNFLDKVSRAYDLVVIDTSPLLAAADPLELAPRVESLLICVRLTTSTRDEAAAVKQAVRLLPERPTGLVVTGAGASDEYSGYYGY